MLRYARTMKLTVICLFLIGVCSACAPASKEWTRADFSEEAFAKDFAACQQEGEDNIPTLSSEEISKQGLTPEEAQDYQSRRSNGVYDYANSCMETKGYERL
jgi:hypothetical protein